MLMVRLRSNAVPRVMNHFNKKKPWLAWFLCHLLNKNLAFSFVYTKPKKTKEQNLALKKREDQGGQKEKKKKEYVSLNGNTRKANGGIEISCSTQDVAPDAIVING